MTTDEVWEACKKEFCADNNRGGKAVRVGQLFNRKHVAFIMRLLNE